MCIYFFEGLQQALAAFAVQFRDAVPQTGNGIDQVFFFRIQGIDLLPELGTFLLGAEVDRAHIVALADQALQAFFRLLKCGGLFTFVQAGLSPYF